MHSTIAELPDTIRKLQLQPDAIEACKEWLQQNALGILTQLGIDDADIGDDPEFNEYADLLTVSIKVFRKNTEDLLCTIGIAQGNQVFPTGTTETIVAYRGAADISGDKVDSQTITGTGKLERDAIAVVPENIEFNIQMTNGALVYVCFYGEDVPQNVASII